MGGPTRLRAWELASLEPLGPGQTLHDSNC